MSKPTDITAIVLCKDEAKILDTCLQSLAFCDAVIVGDDGSVDESIAIAKAKQADVIKLPPGLDMSAKRNFLMKYVQTEWILFVDADETVSPALQHEILQKLPKVALETNGFYIQRSDVFLGRVLKYGETSKTWLVRLARAHGGNWERPVHEIWKIKGQIEQLDGQIIHTSHPDLEEFIEKIDRYTQIEAEKRSARANKFANYIQLFLYPPAKFILNYLFRLGIRDGFPGFVMAWMMSFHSLCVRIKVLEFVRQKTR